MSFFTTKDGTEILHKDWAAASRSSSARAAADLRHFDELDHNIPAGAHKLMAERAGPRRAVEIPGASQVVPVSHPCETVQIVLEAASSVAAANS